MNVLAITQARMGSTRFPGKVMHFVGGKSLLELHCTRLLQAQRIDKVVVATTIKREDKLIEDFCRNFKVDYYRGSENDVLDRFYQAALLWQPKWIVRITSDCPLIDPDLIDQVIERTQNENWDYGCNVLKETFPDGQDIEAFKFTALEIAWKNAKLLSEREHVTPYIRLNSSFFSKEPFKSGNFDSPGDYHTVRMTVDEPADLEVIKKLVEIHGEKASWLTYANEYLANKEISFFNSDKIRNEGYMKSLKNDKSI